MVDSGENGKFNIKSWKARLVAEVKENVNARNIAPEPTWPVKKQDGGNETFSRMQNTIEYDTPPYESQPITQLHESLFSNELKISLAQTIGSITKDETVINSIFEKMLETDIAGGNSNGYLSLITFSTEGKNGGVSISEQNLMGFILERLNIDLLTMDAGEYNYIDNDKLIYQIRIAEEGILPRRKQKSLSLGVLVPKI